MKHKKNTSLLIVQCVPYAFLAMAADVYWGSSMGYLLMFLAAILLALLERKANYIPLARVGCLVSGVLSVLLVTFIRNEAGLHFKPFRVWDMAAILSLIAYMVQTVIWYVKRDREVSESFLLAVSCAVLAVGGGIFLLLLLQAYLFGAFG